MRSDARYERFVKLIQSLFQLVTTDRRHLETVCATLQRVVFEEQSSPHYKNWEAICELGRKNKLLMMVVATLDLDNPDDTTQQIIAAFPECFFEDDVRDKVGPYPLSFIREKADENKRNDPNSGGGPGHDFPESYGVINELGFPKFEFKTDDDTVADELPMIPSHIDPRAKQGMVVEVEGRKLVIVENNRNSGVNVMTLVPAELVDVTT